MSKLRRSMVILASAMAVATGAVVLTTTHAADQVPASAKPGATKPAATNTAVPNTKAPAPGAPQVPEESATIRDDPTIVPDPKQSADNNVSFPNDI
ncbi:MAG TPA: hypothetical protein VGC34_02820 [Steroidobacteraceae bacterium]